LEINAGQAIHHDELTGRFSNYTDRGKRGDTKEGSTGVTKNVPLRLLGTRFKEEIALVNLVPRNHTWTFFKNTLWTVLPGRFTIVLPSYEVRSAPH
jgi:hypothetical protein